MATEHFKLVKDRAWSEEALNSQSIGQSRLLYWVTLGVLGTLIALGYGSSLYMEHQGHWVSGMNNQIVWGMPHVFAIFLILSASGALNIASMSSVFGQAPYQPWARFSGLLAVSLLIGGLIVLVLDLGRPERLIVAMTYYNFKSIFAWNIFLYNGFIAIVVVYLWVMFERNMGEYKKSAAVIAFLWRFILTSGTGSIFGFLVAREFYDSAMMVPIFIVLSLMLGTAIFVLVVVFLKRWSGVGLAKETTTALAQLLGGFILLQLFLIAIFHLTNLYIAEHGDIETFILFEGGRYSVLFWLGQVIVGMLLPLALIFWGRRSTADDQLASRRLVLSCVLVVVGGLCHLYVTIIAGQAYPLELFPGKMISSTFFDGVVAEYAPSLFEVLLGVGGLSLSVLMVILGARVLPFFPEPKA